jgi:probable rRNA maturation factor
MILNRQRTVRVPVRVLQSFLLRLQKEFRLDPEGITIRLVSDAEIARMNETFRAKKGPTDVLSFSPLVTPGTPTRRRGKTRGRKHSGSGNAPEVTYLGDIAISPATARRNAKIYGRSVSIELRILMLHGVLHLLGYDHENDRGQMNRVEGRLRREFGLA